MSKRIRLALTAAVLMAAGMAHAADEAGVIRLSEPVEETADAETFGAPLDPSVPAVTLGKIAADAETYIGKRVRVHASVSQVCRKKGCFFIAKEGATVMRVSFEDYGFFVPTDISGKRVTFIGRVVANDLTEDEAEHLAADLGESTAPLQAGKTYEIVATSVRVPRG
jgi:hypothetical protein